MKKISQAFILVLVAMLLCHCNLTNNGASSKTSSDSKAEKMVSPFDFSSFSQSNVNPTMDPFYTSLYFPKTTDTGKLTSFKGVVGDSIFKVSVYVNNYLIGESFTLDHRFEVDFRLSIPREKAIVKILYYKSNKELAFTLLDEITIKAQKGPMQVRKNCLDQLDQKELYYQTALPNADIENPVIFDVSKSGLSINFKKNNKLRESLYLDCSLANFIASQKDIFLELGIDYLHYSNLFSDDYVDDDFFSNTMLHKKGKAIDITGIEKQGEVVDFQSTEDRLLKINFCKAPDVSSLSAPDQLYCRLKSRLETGNIIISGKSLHIEIP